MRIIFADEAKLDLERLRLFQAALGNIYYLGVSDLVLDAAAMLLDHPNIGARVFRAKTNVRDLYAKSYCIRYEVSPNLITVLRVWHQREDERNRVIHEPRCLYYAGPAPVLLRDIGESVGASALSR